MTELTIKLIDADYQRLERLAKQTGKPVDTLIRNWILKFSDDLNYIDVTQDPIYTMTGYDSNAPDDLSKNIDAYIYRGNPAE